MTEIFFSLHFWTFESFESIQNSLWLSVVSNNLSNMTVDQREVALKRKEELQMKHRESSIFYAPFDPRFPNQNQTR